MANFDKKRHLDFVVCQYCGYNNERKRFNFYGTCLRCHKIMDQKIYLKRLLWQANNRKYLEEDLYHDR